MQTAAAFPTVQHGIAGFMATPLPARMVLQLIAIAAAALLLVGLWTPAAGVLLAVSEISLAFSHSHDPWIHIVLGALGASMAMLRPGTWSADARLFGRKRIQIPIDRLISLSVNPELSENRRGRHTGCDAAPLERGGFWHHHLVNESGPHRGLSAKGY
jgi:hypothetical protein